MSAKTIKIVSIGTASQDVFLGGKIFNAHKEEEGLVEEFTLGSKNEIETVTFSTGGGATNASVTFSKAGLSSYYMGKLGNDVPAKMVLEELKKYNVDTSLVGYHPEVGTAYSTILLAPNGERTVLIYRGASSDYHLSEKDFFGIAPDWFYISSLSGDLAALETIIGYAKKNNIRIAINPGKKEIEEKGRFKDLLMHVDILSLNKEEMAGLFKGDDIAELAKHAARDVKIALVTDGPNGSAACDREKIYAAGMYENVTVIDRSGAGDAFSSGFVAMITKGKTVEEALTYGSANSTGVVGQVGSKAGIISGSKKLHDMTIEVKSL